MSVPVKLKQRLKTIRNLNSIFNALQVITTAKVQKVRKRHKDSSHYLASLEQGAKHLDFSGYSGRNKKGRVTAILISTNRGLCGAFNQGLFYRTQGFLKEHAGRDVRFIVLGRRGVEFVRSRGGRIDRIFTEEEIGFEHFAALSQELIRQYLSGDVSEVYVIHNRFKSVMRQETFSVRVLPYEGARGGPTSRYILEPDAVLLTERFFETLFSAQLFHYYVDSLLGELSSRMFTLKGAIENSKELMNDLVIGLNKIRQQTITRDLLEIISSSECVTSGRCE